MMVGWLVHWLVSPLVGWILSLTFLCIFEKLQFGGEFWYRGICNVRGIVARGEVVLGKEFLQCGESCSVGDAV